MYVYFTCNIFVLQPIILNDLDTNDVRRKVGSAPSM